MPPGPLVVKIGGGAGVAHAPLADELAAWTGPPVVLVHGFSAEATRLGGTMGVPPVFVDSPGGHRSRFTDEATLDVVHLASQRVNAGLVGGLRARGVGAVGVRAGDVGVTAAWKDVLKAVTPDGRTVLRRGDRSGRVTASDPKPLQILVGGGLLPVVAPIARTSKGELASLDGDRCAAALAGALGATALIILTGVPGVLEAADDARTRIPLLRISETDESAGFILGPMKRKVLAAREALGARVPRVCIAAAAAPAPVATALGGAGTEVVP